MGLTPTSRIKCEDQMLTGRVLCKWMGTKNMIATFIKHLGCVHLTLRQEKQPATACSQMGLLATPAPRRYLKEESLVAGGEVVLGRSVYPAGSAVLGWRDGRV